ncbi:ssDNA-binding domain-containing protein [Rhodococcus qingshengii]|uniref:hypothetical protein n=1 Tax=Rhodococcus TaxID=1827 RepID=UPI000F62191D|nr:MULTISPECIES: hypothetical protein [Rhodococcus]AZI61847.1 hypothetical protein EHW12_12215 [Rhodococcus sp. NJ-530]BDQ20055.1 ssDNA-binding domain-containing protein [Rhodococcus qingshengii]
MEKTKSKRTYKRAEVPPELLEATNLDLLDQILNMPGEQGDTYTRYVNLSLGNQALLMMQGVDEPVNTLKRWGEDYGRTVKKGSKAAYIRRPVFRKEENDQGKEEQRLTGFVLSKSMIRASDTEGEPLPEIELPEWSETLAMQNLKVEEVPFEGHDGNIQGWSINRNYAINPIARYPFKTKIHEWSHIEAGHTVPGAHADYLQHRGEREFEAEGSAYIVLNHLGALALFNAAESRHYVQTWMKNQEPSPESAGRVIRVAEKIIKAGRHTPESAPQPTEA